MSPVKPISQVPMQFETRLNKRLIESLLETKAEWRASEIRLSLYIPLEKSSNNFREVHIQLGNLKRKALLELERREVSPEDQEEILAPVERVMLETEASRFRGNGLAIFSGKGFSSILLLSKSPPVFMEIDTHFKLDYILPLSVDRERYYLLGLSLHSVRLWDCDGVSMHEIPLTGTETNIQKTPHFQESHGQVSFHTNSNPGSGGHGSAYFGYGSGQGDGKLMKQEIQHFFQAIDHGVHTILPKKNLPLVLAGVGYLLPIYREVSKYPQLIAEEIIGNPDSQDKIEDLHGRANSLFQHLEKEECNRASHIFKENLATGRGASGVTDVVPSAFYGRLTHLFLEAGKVQWGIFDKASGKINLQNSYVPGAVDLANLACVHALLHGGKVYALTREEMPNNGDFAALCRD